MIFGDNIRLLLVLAGPLLLSLVLHEFAHARVALAFGDPTALRAGRVTLNPLRHLDPIGTIALLFVGFGWARPVPVNRFMLHPPRLGNIMVSLAGPATNLALALLAGASLKILATLPAANLDSPMGEMIFQTLLITMGINIILGLFNMIPLAPLDGHHILGELLPEHMRYGYAMFQQKFGMMLLMMLILGPRLLSYTSGKDIPGPIAWVFHHAMGAAVQLLGI